MTKLALIGFVFAALLFAGAMGLDKALASMTMFGDETALGILVVVGGAVYFVMVFALLGRKWFMSLLKEIERDADKPPLDMDQTIEDFTNDSEAIPDSEPPPKV